MKKFTIGKVAKAAGVGVETIRFYEKKGLIEQPEVRSGSYRTYAGSVVDRIRFIKRAKELGFSLDETIDLLKFADATIHDRKKLTEIAKLQSASIQARLTDLQRMQEALSDWLKNYPEHLPVNSCFIIETLLQEKNPEQP